MGYSDKTGPEGELTMCLTLGTGRHRSRDVVEDGERRNSGGHCLVRQLGMPQAEMDVQLGSDIEALDRSTQTAVESR